MDTNNCIRLADAVQDLEIWKPPEILVRLQKGQDSEPEEFNLVTIIDEIPMSAERHKFMQDKRNRYYMTQNYNRNDCSYRREHIVPFFAKACAKVGIEIRSKGWDEIHQKLALKCIRGRHYSSQQSKKNQVIRQARQGQEGTGSALMVHPDTGYQYCRAFQERRTKTVRPKKGELPCPFEIVLKWEPPSQDETASGGRWYVFHGNMIHHGHLQKDADEIQLYLWHHDQESTRLAVTAMNVHLGCGSATQLLVSQHSRTLREYLVH
jgi:hypothetical protein